LDAVAVGFICKRYGWTEYDLGWCLRLAEKFEWIIDTLVLAGWWKSTAAGGSDYAASLDYLTKAARRGAPYFVDANATMGDLLVWMASDLPDAELRERARQELIRWRSNIQYQARAEASFAWFKAHGERNTGRVSQLTDLVAYQGTVSRAFGSTT
jgi:hypothetical protein